MTKGFSLGDDVSTLTQRLYREFDHITWYFRVPLRRPVISVSEFVSKHGEWDGAVRHIRLSHKLIQENPWDVVVEILKHEMAHQYVQEVLQVADQHGPHFRTACRMLGVAAWAMHAAVDVGDSANFSPLNRTENPETDRMLRRAEKLLSLASSSNEHEALLAMERVREIYAGYNISCAQSSRDVHDDYEYRVIYLGKARIEQHQSMICNILNRFFFVRIVHNHYFDVKSGRELKSIELVGNRPSLKMAEHVFHFLEQQLPMFFRMHGSRLGGAALDRQSRRSYYMGLLQGFYDKLAKQNWGHSSSVDGTAAGGVVSTKLMVVDNPKLDQAVAFRFPRIRSGSWSGAIRDTDSYKAGRSDSKDLNIRRPIETSRNSGLFLR